MNDYPITKWSKDLWPEILHHIYEPPKELMYRGKIPNTDRIKIAIVGSRRPTDYGLSVCEYLIRGLRNHNVEIISGLAYGIDAHAHKTALGVSLPTIALPGSSLHDNQIYPRNHFGLAEEIIKADGTLISELADSISGARWIFPRRNRLIAALADLTIIIEGTETSGTLITARLALEQGQTIGIIPGSIFSDLSTAPLRLLRDGAFPITCAQDIIELLTIPLSMNQKGQELRNESNGDINNGNSFLNTLPLPLSINDIYTYLQKSETSITIQEVQQYISEAEINGHIQVKNGLVYKR